MGLLRRVSNWYDRIKVRAFFRLSQQRRAQIIQNIYSHANRKAGLQGFLDSSYYGKLMDRSPYFDVLLAYARLLEPAVIHQIGCYAASECRWLLDNGYTGTLVASDFDPERLRYLHAHFAPTPYFRIQFRCLDLEGQDYSCLRDAAMVCGLAVLANIQPESVERFFSELSSSRVSLLLLNDIAVPASLTINPTETGSIPCSADRNWYHKFLGLAKKYGFDAFVLPDFGIGAGSHGRCIFVITRSIPQGLHDQAVSSAFASYIQRQPNLLAHISAQAA